MQNGLIFAVVPLLGIAFAALVQAQPAERPANAPAPASFLDPVPFSDRAPEVRSGHLVASAIGAPNLRQNVRASRLEAESQAERRARAMVIAFVDEAMAASRVRPAVATRAHAALSYLCRVEDKRPLVDGSTVVRVALSLQDFERDVGFEQPLLQTPEGGNP